MNKIIGITVGTPASQYANTIKGSANGNPVVLTDVSPFEHEVKVNLSQPEAVKTTVLSRTDEKLTNATAMDENEDSLGNSGDELEFVINSVSCVVEGGIAKVSLNGVSENGTNCAIKYDYNDSEYICPFVKGETIYFVVGLPEDTFTEIYRYETIEDFSGVTVTKYGKNLFQYDPTDNEGSNAKVLEHGENSIILQGLAGGTPGTNVWSNGWYYIAKSGAKVIKGVTNIFSCDLTILDDPYRPTDIKENVGIAVTPGAVSSGSANSGKSYTRPSVGNKVKLYQTFTPTCDSVFFLVKTCSATIKLENFQLEVGNAYTEYEPYQEPITYTADENGNVKGIVGKGEGMTLFADEGISISAEYSVDTKKYIDKKFAELQALVLEV